MNLIDELDTEIAALSPDLTFNQTVEAINGLGGIRGRYMRAFDQLAFAEKWTDPRRHDFSERISRACDRAIQLKTPLTDKGERRWTSTPTDLLTQAEKDALV